MFADRRSAGRLLAARVAALMPQAPIVLALPRGGVPVAAEVAAALKAPLDLLLVRKIGAPGQPELAIGALAEGADEIAIDERVYPLSGATPQYVERERQVALKEIERRRSAYRRGRAPLSLDGRTAVIVDDGFATGSTMRAALQAVRLARPQRVILAVPVGPPSVVASLRGEVDDLVCLAQPADFQAVGAHYADFRQLSDADVIAALDEAVDR
jgi:putative phosphoribosyl transferase